MTDPRWEMVIGLEVHCQLKTQTKLFCSCRAELFLAARSEEPVRPNSNVCPICMGHPGTLPVLNGRAVELGFRTALGLGGQLRDISVFARKNYFYPDLPKGYQISQYEEPFCQGGGIEIAGPPVQRIRIHRIHLEEDAGKLLHAIGAQELEGSLVDFNRAGIPLIEIVSEPDLRSPQEAHQYLTELKSILRYLDVSHCDMEKGEMRCDANISVRPLESTAFGTKAEVKNLNSFRAVKDALEYEYRRQCEILQEGGRVSQETRLWDADRGITESMRSKEEAHDYRYFPEPDLVPLTAPTARVERLRSQLPELPAARRKRFVSQYKIPEYDAGVLTSDRALADYYEAGLSASGNGSSKTLANWIMTELLGKLHAVGRPVTDCPIPPGRMGELARLIENGTLSSRLAKEVFAKMWDTDRPPGEIIETLGLAVVSDEGQLLEWVAAAMAENPRAVSDLRSGKQRAIGSIVGTVMKKSQGKADPARVHKLILERLTK